MMNNFNNNWGNNGFGGYGYNPNQRAPKPTNPLTPEEINILKQKAPQFSLAISQVDGLQAICTHRDNNGDTLIPNGDGTVTCTLCGTRFRPIHADQNTIKDIFQSVCDVLETTKMMYLDIPDDVTRAFFQMIPFLEKGPQLYKIANDNYNKYNNSILMNRNDGSGNTLALFNALVNPMAMAGMGMNGMNGMNAMNLNNANQAFGYPNQGAPVADVTMGVQGGMNPFDANSPAMDAAKTTTDNKQYSL